MNSMFRLILSPCSTRSILLFCAVIGLFGCGSEAEIPQQELTFIRLDAETAAQQAQTIRKDISAFTAEGLELSLWASDSLAPDPIAMSIDNQGKVYLTRTNRQEDCEFDIRGHRDWMTASISFQTVEDRKKFLRTEFAPMKSEQNSWFPDLNGDGVHDYLDLRVVKEDIYCLEDKDQDGYADQAQLYTRDFHEEITDCAGGVLAYNDEVFVGVGPDLWRLEDRNGDGMADAKTSISHGYAVHIGFGAHGMSGLTVGPDGKIYWGIGDIGMNVVDQDGKRWAYPNQGVIVRANPDGSDFEVFAAGLRNTHEFVFDQYGNLISVDNDGDHPGEKERLVYITEGSDSGWRTNWQFGKYTDPDNNLYKVWMDEELYKPRWEGQAAHITPCIMNYHSGPTGMLYNPGTALGPKWTDKFFVVEFTGTPARSFVHAFQLKPKGATFEFAGEEKVVGGILPTGIEFGPDGAMYIGDWIDGWGVKKYGRVWKLDTPDGASTAVRQETQALVQESFGSKNKQELSALLRHDDMRVRQKAQFELAKRNDKETLFAATQQTEHQLARVHGIWGLAQLARKTPKQAQNLIPLLSDTDPEIRAQAAKWLGDVRYEGAGKSLIPLLSDSESRVQFFAAEALGRIAHVPATEALIAMLQANDDKDAYLRHAGTLALARMGNSAPLVALSDHSSRALRIAAVVALRRLRDPGIAVFLQDQDEHIVTDVARAINDDYSIEAALPDLAKMLADTRFSNEALLRRAINAALRVGGETELQLLIDFISRTSAPEEMRMEAIAALGTWTKPSVLDRVDGRYRGEIEREGLLVQQRFAPVFEQLIPTASAPIQVALAEAVGRLQVQSASPSLAMLVKESAVEEVGKAAFEALALLKTPELSSAVEDVLGGRNEEARLSALRLLPELAFDAERMKNLLSRVMRNGSVKEQQVAVKSAAQLPAAIGASILGESLDRLRGGRLNPEVRLDLVEAIEGSEFSDVKEALSTYQAELAAVDPLGPYRAALTGGDRRAGRNIFAQHAAAQCTRCHAVGDYGQSEVGPNLAGIGKTLSKEQLLEALVDPSARVAPGYGMVTLTLKDGEKHVGLLMEESPRQLILKTEEAEPLKIPTVKIARRVNAPSAMPPMGLILSKRELRDMVAFLESL